MGFFTPVTEQPSSPWSPTVPTVTNTIFGNMSGSPLLTVTPYTPPTDPVVPAIVAPDSPIQDVEPTHDGGKWQDYDPYEMDGFLDKNGPYHPYDKEYWGGSVRPSQFDQDSFFGKLKDTVGFMRPGVEAMMAFNKFGGMLATPMGPIGLLGMALGAQPTSMLNSWNEPVMQAQLQQTWGSLSPEMQAQFGSFKGYNATGLGMFGTGNSMNPGYNAMTQKAMDLIGVKNVDPIDFAMRNRIDAIAATRGWNMAGLAEVGKATTALSYSGMRDFNALTSQFEMRSLDYVANAHISDMAAYTGNPKMKETAALVTALGYEDRLSDMVNKDGSLTDFGKQMSDIADSLKDNMNSSIHNQKTKDVYADPTATEEQKQKSWADWANAKLNKSQIPDYIGDAIHMQLGVSMPSVTDVQTPTATATPSIADTMNANASKYGWGGLANAVSQVGTAFGTDMTDVTNDLSGALTDKMASGGSTSGSSSRTGSKTGRSKESGDRGRGGKDPSDPSGHGAGSGGFGLDGGDGQNDPGGYGGGSGEDNGNDSEHNHK